MWRSLLAIPLFLAVTIQATGQSFNFTTPSFTKVGFEAPDTATITFIGDVMMHKEQISRAQSDSVSAFSSYFSLIKGTLEGADASVANMEFALGGKPYTGYPCFSAPDSYPEYVASCGVDVFLTANNHILDKGKDGVIRTLDIYDKMEIEHTGTFRDSETEALKNPLIVAVKGTRIALINFTYGTNIKPGFEYPKVNRMDTTEIGGLIEKAKASKVDFIIALPHWGIEYSLNHSAQQKELSRWLIDKGCDAIIGTHPHVVQDTEFYTVRDHERNRTKSISVIYSLGNCVSNMSAVNTQVGMIASMKIITDRFGEKHLSAAECQLTWCSRPGYFNDGYTVIPIEEYLGKRDLWMNKWDYDKMVVTYERIKDIINK